MRTDSVNLSELAVQASRQVITNMLGEQYLHTRHFSTKTKGAQEAHEAIRPTYMEKHAIDGSSQEKKLYDLIWKRTIASQMSDAELEKTTVTISASGASDSFVAIGQVVKFDGFLRIYKESFDEDAENEDESRLLPPLEKDEKLECRSVVAMERFTQHPLRYTEASLVRKLEELGIGRPSTYAPTISTIQQREYVVKGDKPGHEIACSVLALEGGKITESVKEETVGAEKSKLLPTDIGIVVNDFLTKYFPNILDYNFTANVEKQFDEVAEGHTQWTDMMKDFYKDFHPSVENAMSLKSEHKVGERVLGVEPGTGKPVSVKIGRFGPVVQIGVADDTDKPRFAQLRKDLSMETVTLEQALELFKLPRTLGEYEGQTLAVGAGRFGPYVHHGEKYISMPKGMDPLSITLEDAIALIEAKRQAEAKRVIRTFAEDPDMQVLNGRYGPYISYKEKNYRIPAEITPEDLNLEGCFMLIKLQEEKASMPRKRGRRAAKKE